MIEMLTGLPGAGKSYGALLFIMEKLERSSQFVITNCALNLDELNAYYNRRGGAFVDVFSRIRLITTAEAREFWRFRGEFTVLPSRPVPKRRSNEVFREVLKPAPEDVNSCQVVDVCNDWLADLGVVTPGVFYVLEEAHLLFDSRSWQNSAACLTFYNSQHRKFRDDALFVTQFLKMVEIRVKGFAENFYVYRNFKGRKVYQFLRMPARMRELKFGMDPSTPGAVQDSETWRTLDPAKAKCYWTMKGVGIGGAVAPEERKVSGFALPWWSPFAALIVVAVLFLVGSRMVVERAGTTFLKTPAQIEASRAKSTAQPTSPSEPNKSREKPVSSPSKGVPAESRPVWVAGLALRRDEDPVVYLSDGRTLRGPDLVLVDEDRVVLRSGEVVARRRPFSEGAALKKRP